MRRNSITIEEMIEIALNEEYGLLSEENVLTFSFISEIMNRIRNCIDTFKLVINHERYLDMRRFLYEKITGKNILNGFEQVDLVNLALNNLNILYDSNGRNRKSL